MEEIKSTLYPERAQKLLSMVHTSGKEILFLYYRRLQIQSSGACCSLYLDVLSHLAPLSAEELQFFLAGITFSVKLSFTALLAHSLPPLFLYLVLVSITAHCTLHCFALFMCLESWYMNYPLLCVPGREER